MSSAQFPSDSTPPVGPDETLTDPDRWAAVEKLKGGIDDAAIQLARARARKAMFGEDEPTVRIGRYVVQRLFERALRVKEKALGPEHPLVADSLVGLARLALSQHRAAEAMPLAERAVTLYESGNASPTELASAQLLLAQALGADGKPSTRALDLASAARDVFRDAGLHYRSNLAEVEAFLEARGSARP